jgi:ribonucleoside-diphosphate reductase alpha chain
MDAYSIAISIGLQYGVPLEAYIDKFLNMRFEPAGLTDDADIRMAQSVMDYIFRRLALDFLSFEARSALGIYSADERSRQLETGSYTATELETAADTGVADVEVQSLSQSAPVIEITPAPMGEVHSSAELMERITGKASDAPMCFTCGIKMRPSGSCYACEGCGSTSGCS